MESELDYREINKYEIYDRLFNKLNNNNDVEEIAKAIIYEINNDKLLILDLGIGTGAFSIPIYISLKTQGKGKDIKWLGIDKDSEAINKAKEKVKNEKSIIFIEADIEECAFNSKKLQNDLQEFNYNVIFAPAFFHHLVYWDKVLDFFVKKLSEDGIFVDCEVGGDVHIILGRWEYVNRNDKAVEVWQKVYEKLPVSIVDEINISNYGILEYKLINEMQFCKSQSITAEVGLKIKESLELLRILSVFKPLSPQCVSKIRDEVESALESNCADIKLKYNFRIWKRKTSKVCNGK